LFGRRLWKFLDQRRATITMTRQGLWIRIDS